MNWEKIKDKIKTIIIVVFVVYMTALYIGIHHFGKTTKGIITGVSEGRRHHCIIVKYSVNGEMYEIKPYSFGKYKSCFEDHACIGDSCVVKYSPLNPQSSDLIYE
jgi:hypothetical protein